MPVKNSSSAEAVTRRNTRTAKDILKSRPLFNWLLPWNIRTYFYLKGVFKNGNRFLRVVKKQVVPWTAD